MSFLPPRFVRENVDLAPFTTYKLGGPARWFAQVERMRDLFELAERWRRAPVPLLVLGRGSNVVIGEGGFDGLVVRLGREFREVRHHPDEIEAGAAVPSPLLARSSVRLGRLGLEFLSGVPGTVGGAVRQNAGCHGSETKDWLSAAEIFDWPAGETRRRTPSELGLSYRHSDLTDDQLVIRAWFRFVEGDVTEGESRLREIGRWRKEHQPGGTLNAGSVFKNPPGDAAGRIIDALGLKGFRIGGVRVSERHANFFVAESGARPSDVRSLVMEVQRRVEAATGIRLEPELRFVGEFES